MCLCWVGHIFCLNFNFKILTKPCAQSLNKKLQNFGFQICTKMLSTRFSASTVTSIELASSHAGVTSIKSTKRRQLVTSVANYIPNISKVCCFSSPESQHYLLRKICVRYRQFRICQHKANTLIYGQQNVKTNIIARNFQKQERKLLFRTSPLKSLLGFQQAIKLFACLKRCWELGQVKEGL